MNPLLKNSLAIVLAVMAGMVLNLTLLQLFGVLIPPPEGVDVTNIESLKANIHLFGPQNFIGPFVAHAGGTLAAAFIVARMAARRQKFLALAMGAFFLIGGVQMVVTLPAPAWYNALDLLLAYIPMAWLGWTLAGRPE